MKLPSLHLNSEYSIMQSNITIDALISFAIKNEMKYLVLTDRNNLMGVPEFYSKCIKNKIKPIIGLELDISNYKLILIARNNDGYNELVKLSSDKMTGKEITIDDVLDKNIYIIDHPTLGHYAKYKTFLSKNNYFIPTNDIDVSNSVSTKVVNTLDGNKDAFEIISSIKDREVKPSLFEMYDNLEINSTIQLKYILEDCNVKLENVPPLPMTDDPKDAFILLRDKISLRFKLLKIDDSLTNSYIERIKYELKTIYNLGFVEYFNIVSEIVDYVKTNEILMGSGRGSAAGSLICYVLGITDLDPIKNGLLFERFINVERVSLPDIDIDIEGENREQILDHISERFGKDNVAQITTFIRVGAKMALREAGRFLKIQDFDLNQISKTLSSGDDLHNSYNSNQLFKTLIDRSKSFKDLFRYACAIENLIKSIGTHPAGVVISNNKIINRAPILKSTHNQIQYEMKYLENFGLIKFDLLSLKTLTTIRKIKENILKNYETLLPSFRQMTIKDKKVNALLSKGFVKGIFQLESPGMIKTLGLVGVESFDDLANIISLYRPGPMKYIKRYAENKNRKNDNITTIDKVLSSTRGIIVYQEQIMQIAQSYAHMSYSKADLLRRAISKKDISIMSELKSQFIEGANRNGYSVDESIEVYGMIEEFASYGFNKSHAYAYSKIVYYMGWLKVHFPTNFYSVLIDDSYSDSKEMVGLISELKKLGLSIYPPKINISTTKTISRKNKIVLPLTAARGVGVELALKIINARGSKKFVDIYDFIIRAYIQNITIAELRIINDAGFLGIFGNPDTINMAIDSLYRYAQLAVFEKDGERIVDTEFASKPRISEFPLDMGVALENEKKIYGYKILYFPTKKHELETKIIDLKVKDEKKIIFLLDELFIKKDKNGNEFGIYTISDSTSSVKLFVFQEQFRFIKNTKLKTIVRATILVREYNGRKSISLKDRWEIINE